MAEKAKSNVSNTSNEIQAIMPPADVGAPYSENKTNIDPMNVIPKIGGTKANEDICRGYGVVSNPTCKKGPGEFPNENIKPWRPKGRKG